MDEKFIEEDYLKDTKNILATDEVGRGCIAGPVTVASVMVNNVSNKQLLYLKKLGVTDSKKLNSKKRKAILEKIGIKIEAVFNGGIFCIENEEISFEFKVSNIAPQRIDEINILQATFEGMIHSAQDLIKEDCFWLIDGNQIPRGNTHEKVDVIVKGDSKSVLIGLASIIAKESRDYLMNELHKEFSFYNWDSNSGYGTVKHLKGIKEHGFCLHHRISFTVDLNKV